MAYNLYAPEADPEMTAAAWLIRQRPVGLFWMAAWVSPTLMR